MVNLEQTIAKVMINYGILRISDGIVGFLRQSQIDMSNLQDFLYHHGFPVRIETTTVASGLNIKLLTLPLVPHLSAQSP